MKPKIQYFIRQRNFWLTRQLFTTYTISRGFDTMLMDSDAIILRDPYPWMNRTGADMLFGLGHYEDTDIAVCAGTAIYRSSPGTCKSIGT